MEQQAIIMAEPREVVERSFNINKKLGPRLIEAAKQDAILRIGWTSAGDPVPKNGELGLCPNLPLGSKMRALGVLGSWIAAFGSGVISQFREILAHFSVLVTVAIRLSVNKWLVIFRDMQCAAEKSASWMALVTMPVL